MNLYLRMKVHGHEQRAGYRNAWLASRYPIDYPSPALRRWACANLPPELLRAETLSGNHAKSAKKAGEWRRVYRWRMMSSWRRIASVSFASVAFAVLGALGAVGYFWAAKAKK